MPIGTVAREKKFIKGQDEEGTRVWLKTIKQDGESNGCGSKCEKSVVGKGADGVVGCEMFL